MFTSYEKNRKKAYVQFIRSKRKRDQKEDAPDFLHLVSSKGYENETVVKKPKLWE